jgi:hypothetical protein
MSFTDELVERRVEGLVSPMESRSFSVMCIDDNVLLIDALERRLNMERALPGFTGWMTWPLR